MLVTRDLGYRFPMSTRDAVGPINLEVEAGEFVLVTGPTGSGKSTLIRLLAGLLQQHGRGTVTGSVWLDEEHTHQIQATDRARRLAFVTQTPQDQLLCSTLLDEVCFGMESASVPLEDIEPAALSWLQRVGLRYPAGYNPDALSGGEQQRLVLSASLSAGARLVLLDEPLSQLDPRGSQEVISLLKGMAIEGWTIVIVEHRLTELWDAADRLIVMESGKILSDSTPDTVHLPDLRRLGLSIPPLVDFQELIGDTDLNLSRLPSTRLPKKRATPSSVPLVETPAITVTYPGHEHASLDIEPMVLHRGERVALIGANGSGKSTLLRQVCDSAAASQKRTVLVPQNADLTLFNPTVYDEIAFGPSEQGAADVDQQAMNAAACLGVGGFLKRPPHSLSKGQRVRVAVAAALSCQPELLILDEPTAGQDQGQMRKTMSGLATALGESALLFATHDVQLALDYATRILILDHGLLTYDGTPEGALAKLDVVPAWVTFCLEHDLPVATPAAVMELLND